MKRFAFYSFSFCIILVIAGQVKAVTTLSTLPFSSGISPFGEPDSATYGQTITVPAVDNVLDTFSFWSDDILDNSFPDYVDFAAYVMAWDGNKATGPILWQSIMQTSTNNGGADGFEKFSFDTGGVALTPGEQYVLFLSSSDFFDGSNGVSNTPAGGTAYTGGHFVYMSNGSDFSALTTNNWDQLIDLDWSFEASFCLLYTSPSPRDATLSRMPSSA